ncbi:disease resistance protein RPV1-like [Prosopis cineraria]|uniref:disease resistance protein RPV1-like n=1 Tax=Prosopis cineraria TaxID=364024 RepID=UPI00240FC35B|nr:disease resistance protein RPV1-like [Prosopis cineraria]
MPQEWMSLATLNPCNGLDVNGVVCSSSSYGSTKRRKYDVFLSSRGEDTRTSFTDHLYDALRRKGIRTFRDEEGLERGQYINPSLLQAIEESCSAIAVLSPGYASSTWCLDELQKILHSKKELDLQVFPIFYGVDPSDVRKQKGSFEEAFMKHEERFTQDKMKVQRWRRVLEEVASLSGWDSRNRHETEFIESIAKEMKYKLHDESPFDLGALVGIESKLDELESLIAIDSEGVRSIGIWGTGGLGKTTLARAFYDWKCKDFEGAGAIRGIAPSLEKSSDALWDPEAFSKMSNLKLLIISSCSSHVSHCQLNLPHGLKSLPNELRVSEWEGYPLDSLPRHTQLDKLVHLKMQHSKLKQLWKGTQSLKRLMSIDLSHSKYLTKTPDFDGIDNLETLILEGCSNLVEIHQSLGQHKNLVIVNLKGCIKVKILPRKFEMDRLQTFVLSVCSKIRKLPEFGKDMKCLSKLDLEDTAISKYLNHWAI